MDPKIVFLIVIAIFAVVIIVKIIVDSRRPVVTTTEVPKDAIAQRVEAVGDLNLTMDQTERLVNQILEDSSKK